MADNEPSKKTSPTSDNKRGEELHQMVQEDIEEQRALIKKLRRRLH